MMLCVNCQRIHQVYVVFVCEIGNGTITTYYLYMWCQPFYRRTVGLYTCKVIVTRQKPDIGDTVFGLNCNSILGYGLVRGKARLYPLGSYVLDMCLS